MKKLLMIGLIAFSVAACGKKEMAYNSVPDQVMASFNQRYPEARDVTWENDRGNYQVEFKDNGNKREVIYTPDGKLIGVNR